MIEKAAYLSDNRVTNISKSFTHKMAAKTNWHRYGIKLGRYHPCIGIGPACVSVSGHYNV